MKIEFWRIGVSVQCFKLDRIVKSLTIRSKVGMTLLYVTIKISTFSNKVRQCEAYFPCVVDSWAKRCNNKYVCQNQEISALSNSTLLVTTSTFLAEATLLFSMYAELYSKALVHNEFKIECWLVSLNSSWNVENQGTHDCDV